MTNHRKVISWIHIMRGKHFAIHEIQKATGVSNSSVTRLLRKLCELGLINHKAQSARKRNYSVSSRWPDDVKAVWENYELARMLNI